MSNAPYIELQCTTYFSFLRGASSPLELLKQAGEHGMEALAITDRNSLAGIVRAFHASKELGIRSIVGCRLDLIDGASVLVYPTNRAAYSRLCRLLSVGKSRAGKGKCALEWDDVAAYSGGLIGILVPNEPDEVCERQLQQAIRCFGDDTHLALTLRRRPNDALRLHQMNELAVRLKVKTVVTNDVLYHTPPRRIMQDVVTCIRLRCTIDQLGYKREMHADRHLIPPEEMQRLFRQYPQALDRTVAIAKRCTFSLDELTYQYPREAIIPGLTAQQALEKLTWEGAEWRYPQGISDTVANQLRHELRLINELSYAPYFLTVHSIVKHARSEGILCQGRGSAANSAVCFMLGVTAIDPERGGGLFERFVSKERPEPPDIDIDFEHDRREQVIQWVYEHYGRQRAALCSTLVTYGPKGALRDVGKALGLPADMMTGLSQQIWAFSKDGVTAEHAEEMNLNTNDRRLRLALNIARHMIGMPRHTSQHPGGFVLTDDRLDDLVPIEPARMDDRQIIEWDKVDIDILRFMKVDLLGLGMLTTLNLVFGLLQQYKGIELDIASIPSEDEATFDMICSADTVGTFQVESRAQMNMHRYLLPRREYDICISVAIVRPGPIQGGMVNPYLARRQGLEAVEPMSPALEKILGKTLGIPLFQEQVMGVVVECAGYTPGEADQMRRDMATFKFTGGVSHHRERVISGMIDNGYTREYAERIFSQIEGFGSYGFPESHAASFAILAYASCWLKRHHPDVFCAGILNSQPMGFYAIAQLVHDAQEHHVPVRPVCINESGVHCTMEETGEQWQAVRLGLRFVAGLSQADAEAIVKARTECCFLSIEDLWVRSGVKIRALECLAKADAFLASLSLPRRDALWAIKALRDEELPLFHAANARANRWQPEIVEDVYAMKPMSEGQEVIQDYKHVGLTLRRYPTTFLRPYLTRMGAITCKAANETRNGRMVKTAGLVLFRQRPGSAKGVMFITLEDETEKVNAVIWKHIYEKHRSLIHTAKAMAIRGKIQNDGRVVHLIAHELIDLTGQLSQIGTANDQFDFPASRGDELRNSGGYARTDDTPGAPVRDIFIPDLHIDLLKTVTKDFR